MDLLAGGVVVLAASFLGGVTGFGYSLVATPLLLVLGFPLPFVVTANLALACVTRISVAYRFRSDARPGRAAGLIAGSVPGLWLGAVVLTTVDVSTIRCFCPPTTEPLNTVASRTPVIDSTGTSIRRPVRVRKTNRRRVRAMSPVFLTTGYPGTVAPR